MRTFIMLFFICAYTVEVNAQGVFFQSQPVISKKRKNQVKVIKRDPARKQIRFNKNFAVTAFSNEMHISHQDRKERMALKSSTLQYNPTKETAIPDRKEVAYENADLWKTGKGSQCNKRSGKLKLTRSKKVPKSWR